MTLMIISSVIVVGPFTLSRITNFMSVIYQSYRYGDEYTDGLLMILSVLHCIVSSMECICWAKSE